MRMHYFIFVMIPWYILTTTFDTLSLSIPLILLKLILIRFKYDKFENVGCKVFKIKNLRCKIEKVI